MTEWESITAVVLAGVLGGIVGAALTSLYWAKRERWASEQETRREVIASWLAARIALGRASISFVTAFRSLGAVGPESRYFSLRQDEAQRARAQWARAAQDLDIAEAKLRVWHPSEDLGGRAARLDRISVESLRAGIDGDEAAADRLMQSVLAMERQAIAFAEETVAELAPSRRVPALREMLRRVVAKLEAVADGWARDDT